MDPHGPVIVLADDNPPFLEMCIGLLQSCGYRVLPARGAPETREAMSREVPNLPITDLTMAHFLGGFELSMETGRDITLKDVHGLLANTSSVWDRGEKPAWPGTGHHFGEKGKRTPHRDVLHSALSRLSAVSGPLARLLPRFLRRRL